MATPPEPPSTDKPLVRAITASGFRIGGQIYDKPLLLYGSMIYDWPQAQLAEAGILVSLATLDPAPELLLLGTGRTAQTVGPELLHAMKRVRVNVDVMDSRSAARTYNVLVLEGRRVAVALLPPDL